MRCVQIVFLLVLFCVTSFVQDARACSCVELKNYTKYCQAEFAVKAHVAKETSSSPHGDRVYTIITGVRELRTLKGNFTKVDLKKVYTAFQSATCGVTLQPGKVYLLSGSIDRSKSPHRLRINLCDWIQIWKTLTPAEKNFVRNGYRTRCRREVNNSVYGK